MWKRTATTISTWKRNIVSIINRSKEMIMKIEMEAIGFVENDVKDKKDVSWGEDTSSIVLNEQYISGLKGLDDF